jgi:YD repeat-containing protein
MTVAGQAAVSYVWDNANRLNGITQGTASVSFNYDSASRRRTLTLPSGIELAYSGARPEREPKGQRFAGEHDELDAG